MTVGTASTQGYYPNTVICHPTSNAFIMRCEIDGVSNLTEFKTWLAANPQEVQYVMAESIEIPIADTAFESAVTFKGATTMCNDAQAGMKATYVTGGTSDET